MEPPYARLSVVASFEPAHVGDVFLLTHERMRFGRDTGCVFNEIVLYSDELVARGHGRFERRGDRWWVVDLASVNSIYVNERRVDGAVALASGDHLRIGRVTVELTLGEA